MDPQVAESLTRQPWSSHDYMVHRISWSSQLRGIHPICVQGSVYLTFWLRLSSCPPAWRNKNARDAREPCEQIDQSRSQKIRGLKVCRDQFFSGARLKCGPKNAKSRTEFGARFRLFLKHAPLKNWPQESRITLFKIVLILPITPIPVFARRRCSVSPIVRPTSPPLPSPHVSEPRPTEGRERAIANWTATAVFKTAPNGRKRQVHVATWSNEWMNGRTNEAAGQCNLAFPPLMICGVAQHWGWLDPRKMAFRPLPGIFTSVTAQTQTLCLPGIIYRNVRRIYFHMRPHAHGHAIFPTVCHHSEPVECRWGQ